MNSNLQPKLDVHQISLDLEGLDELLGGAADCVIVEAEPVQPEPSESELIVRLLEQLRCLNEQVGEARARLISANERMSSLATMVQLQTGQIDQITHYQTRAAKVAGLERKVLLLEQENEQLRQVWWRKIFFWLKQQV